MAEYWPRSFMHLDFISVHKHAKKKLVNIQPSCPNPFVWASVGPSHQKELIFILNLGRHISCIGDRKDLRRVCK